MKDTDYIESGAKHALIDYLGFEEGSLYFGKLNKNNKIEAGYSYSKRYRLLKSLYEKGAIGKIRVSKSNNFVYILLPPSFLYESTPDTRILDYLDELYLMNIKNSLEKGFYQIMMKDECSFIIFLLKYVMKKNAKLDGIQGEIKIINNIDSSKVSFTGRKTEYKIIGMIDDEIGFEFIKILSEDGTDSIGYVCGMGNTRNRSNTRHIEIINKRLQ
jgi:hypothetical protein